MMFLCDSDVSANSIGQAVGLLPAGQEKERDFNVLKQGLQNRRKWPSHVKMLAQNPVSPEDTERENKRAVMRAAMRAVRDARRSSGRVLVSTDLPGDLIAQIDHEKQVKGVRGRTPIIEAALRFYFEKKQGL